MSCATGLSLFVIHSCNNTDYVHYSENQNQNMHLIFLYLKMTEDFIAQNVAFISGQAQKFLI